MSFGGMQYLGHLAPFHPAGFPQAFYREDIPGQPVNEMPVRRIEVIYDDYQALGFGWKAADIQRRAYTGSLAGILNRQQAAVEKDRAGDRELSGACRHRGQAFYG